MECFVMTYVPAANVCLHSLVPAANPSAPAGPSLRLRCGGGWSVWVPRLPHQPTTRSVLPSLPTLAVPAQPPNAQEVEEGDLIALNPSLNTSNGAIYLGAWRATLPVADSAAMLVRP